MALNVSLCFAGLQTELYNVSMSTTNDPKEPEVRWDSEDGAESGQVCMGTTGSHLSPAERGILSISDFRHTDGLEAEDIKGSLSTLWKGPNAFTGMFSDTAGGSYMVCNFCDFAGWPVQLFKAASSNVFSYEIVPVTEDMGMLPLSVMTLSHEARASILGLMHMTCVFWESAGPL